MFAERRQYERVRGPFEGSWSIESDHHESRITDLSPGGCFVDSSTHPEPGATIAVTVLFGDSRFTVPAEVVYLDKVQGFGVRFQSSEHSRALAYVMGSHF